VFGSENFMFLYYLSRFIKSRNRSNEKVGPTSRLGKKKQYAKKDKTLNSELLLFLTAKPKYVSLVTSTMTYTEQSIFQLL
jgi:hypothetical protein